MANIDYLVDIHPLTGEYVKGWPRIQASIITILRTKLKTRIMREWFGSNFLNIQDKPLSQEVWMDSIIAAVEAINTFEPEFKITTMTITRAASDGSIEIKSTGIDLVEDRNRTLRETLQR